MTTIRLILGNSFAKPYINNKYTVRGWDYDLSKRTQKTFESSEEAEQYLNTVRVRKWNERIIEVTPKQILENSKFYTRFYRIAPLVPEEYEEIEVKLDPRFLGIWLGDGHSNYASITNIDHAIIEWCQHYADSLDLEFKRKKDDIIYTFVGKDGPCSDCRRRFSVETFKQIIEERDSGASYYSLGKKYGISRGYLFNMLKNREYYLSFRPHRVMEGLRFYDLLNNKHIPDVYLKNSRKVRLEVLAGLIDTDGHCNGTSYAITQKNETLANDIITLAKSLGFFVKSERKYLKSKIMKSGGNWYTYMYITGPTISEIPVIIDRKKINTDIESHCRYPLIDLDHIK